MMEYFELILYKEGIKQYEITFLDYNSALEKYKELREEFEDCSLDLYKCSKKILESW